jgi:hypothetical protein
MSIDFAWGCEMRIIPNLLSCNHYGTLCQSWHSALQRFKLTGRFWLIPSKRVFATLRRLFLFRPCSACMSPLTWQTGGKWDSNFLSDSIYSGSYKLQSSRLDLSVAKPTEANDADVALRRRIRLADPLWLTPYIQIDESSLRCSTQGPSRLTSSSNLDSSKPGPIDVRKNADKIFDVLLVEQPVPRLAACARAKIGRDGLAGQQTVCFLIALLGF